jgi:lipopolysaccharide transport system permease protein
MVTFNPVSIAGEVFRNFYLIRQLVKRDVLLRYRGAFFGVLWVFLSPLMMLAVFAFVFGQIFPSRWPQQGQAVPHWLTLYAGLIAFNVFSEAVSRAPTAVRNYPSFVKKIIFPVHILPIVPMGAALVHALFNYAVLLAALAWTGNLHVSVILFPLLLVPIILLAIGLSWFLAAWGVFIKDMSQIVPIFVQMLLFLSPVFYPSSAVPEFLQPVYHHSPLSTSIEAVRSVVLGQPAAWNTWLTALVWGVIATSLGYAFFQHSREEFADAL